MSFRNLLNCDVKGRENFILHSDIQFEFKIYEITIFFIANFVVTIFSKRIILNFIKNLFIGSGIVLIGLVFL